MLLQAAKWAVVLAEKLYLFLEYKQLISQPLNPDASLLELLPCCAYCLIIEVRGYLGIVQLQKKRDKKKRTLYLKHFRAAIKQTS